MHLNHHCEDSHHDDNDRRTNDHSWGSSLIGYKTYSGWGKASRLVNLKGKNDITDHDLTPDDSTGLIKKVVGSQDRSINCSLDWDCSSRSQDIVDDVLSGRREVISMEVDITRSVNVDDPLSIRCTSTDLVPSCIGKIGIIEHRNILWFWRRVASEHNSRVLHRNIDINWIIREFVLKILVAVLGSRESTVERTWVARHIDSILNPRWNRNTTSDIGSFIRRFKSSTGPVKTSSDERVSRWSIRRKISGGHDLSSNRISIAQGNWSHDG